MSSRWLVLERRRENAPVGSFDEKRGRIGRLAAWARFHDIQLNTRHVFAGVLGTLVGILGAFFLEHLVALLR